MAQTKQERAASRQKNLDRQRRIQLMRDGFELFEAERGLEVQCMTCCRTWKRLGRTNREAHRMICPPDPNLARFLSSEVPTAPRILSLRHKPW